MTYRLYTTTEAGKLLNVTNETVKNIIRKHELPHYLAGRFILLNTEQLQALKNNLRKYKN